MPSLAIFSFLPRTSRPVFMGAALCATLALACPALAADLAANVKRTLASAKIGQARVGISIVDVSTGSSLVAIRADEAFIPASNMKLLASGAALLVLGSDYHFKTTFALDEGRLIVTGSGDPALGDPDVLRTMTPATTVNDILANLAGAVAKAGVTNLREIVIDDRVFDREYVHPTWSTHHLLNAYGAQVCGLNFHANIISYFPKPNPQGPGSAPSLNIEPPAPWLTIINKAETVAENRNTVWMHRPANTNTITVQGQIGGKQNIQKSVTIHDAASFFGRILADRLQASGVTIAGPAASAPNVRLAAPDETLAPGRTIAIISTPIADILYRCNTHSENLYAEALLKSVGHAVTREPGSWSNGTVVVRMLLAEKVSPEAAASTTIIDGSGLSRDNAVSPGTFTAWLRVMATSENADAFVASLASPGKLGTLEKRFRAPGAALGNVLSAKSGMLKQVRTLSGFLTNPVTGRRIAFSILANDVAGDADQSILKLHEDTIRLADQWLTESAATTPTTTTTKAGE